jgi:hypothetical protein
MTWPTPAWWRDRLREIYDSEFRAAAQARRRREKRRVEQEREEHESEIRSVLDGYRDVARGIARDGWYAAGGWHGVGDRGLGGLPWAGRSSASRAGGGLLGVPPTNRGRR